MRRSQVRFLSAPPSNRFLPAAINSSIVSVRDFLYTVFMNCRRKSLRFPGAASQKVVSKETPACIPFNLSPPNSQAVAFALLELLVVVGIVLLLMTMYWGGNSGGKQKALKAACQQNLQKIYLAAEIYAKDSAGKFPVAANARTSEEPLNLLVPRYTSDTSVFICPGSKDDLLPAGEPLLKHKISYAYYQGRDASQNNEVLLSDRQLDTQSKAVGQQIFSATGKGLASNHGKSGGNFLFCDGRVEPSAAVAPFSLVLTQGVVLLNPKP
jgi:prepilin-type processing-associated H-X9-DG protein